MLSLVLLALLASATVLRVGQAQSAPCASASVADGPSPCSLNILPHSDVANTVTPLFDGTGVPKRSCSVQELDVASLDIQINEEGCCLIAQLSQLEQGYDEMSPLAAKLGPGNGSASYASHAPALQERLTAAQQLAVLPASGPVLNPGGSLEFASVTSAAADEVDHTISPKRTPWRQLLPCYLRMAPREDLCYATSLTFATMATEALVAGGQAGTRTVVVSHAPASQAEQPAAAGLLAAKAVCARRRCREVVVSARRCREAVRITRR